MNDAVTSNARIEDLDAAINEAILNGTALDAFETYYAPDVVMQENDAAPTAGKDANRQHEQEFFNAITEFRGAEVLVTGRCGNVTYTHWRFDFTHREWGIRNYEQLAVRTWRDGQVVREVFHYA